MKKGILLSTLFFAMAGLAMAGTFTSIATGDWAAATTWSAAGDADGLPDSDDNVTIASGHNVTVSTSLQMCKDLIVNSGGTITINKGMYIGGDYTQNGTEAGSSTNGLVYFTGVGKTISGTGTINNGVQYVFQAGTTQTIASGTSITKLNKTTIYSNITITNFGFLSVTSIVKATGSVTNYNFINGTNGTLNLKFRNFFAGGTFTANAAGNTVRINYSLDALPTPVGQTYYNLMIISPNTTLSGNTIVTNDFTINASGSISANNFNLTIGRHFIRAGGWTPSAGFNVTMNGTVAQNITNSAVSSLQFQGLIIDNPVSVKLNSGSYDILDHLTINQGTFDANSRTVNLVSNAGSTAVIGSCGATAAITNGSGMRLQRFISARSAGYSDMSGSVVGQTVADFDDELLIVYTYSPPDYYPSIFGYDETAWDYVPVTSSAQTLDPGVGFEVYLDSDGNQISFNNTTVINSGTPTIGNVDMSGYITFNNDGWNLVGNPYHANLSWDALQATTSGISTDFMFYDETIDNGDGTFGDFATASTGSGELIAPNQGFWVNATSGSPTFIFTEAIKSTSTSSTFRTKENREKFFCVRLKNIDDRRFSSGTNFRFSADPENAEKKSLPNKRLPHPEAPSLCSVSPQGKDLKINLLNSSDNTVSVPLKFEAGISGTHTIEAQNIEMATNEGYTCITLHDKKTGQFVDLSSGKYQFYAEKGEEKNRFTLILSKTGNCQKSADVATVSNQVDIYQANNEAIVKFNYATETNVNISITDLLGRPLTPSQAFVVKSQETHIQLPAEFTGVYLINVYHNNQVSSRKLFR